MYHHPQIIITINHKQTNNFQTKMFEIFKQHGSNLFYTHHKQRNNRQKHSKKIRIISSYKQWSHGIPKPCLPPPFVITQCPNFDLKSHFGPPPKPIRATKPQTKL
jgi:hypothetical protein